MRITLDQIRATGAVPGHIMWFQQKFGEATPDNWEWTLEEQLRLLRNGFAPFIGWTAGSGLIAPYSMRDQDLSGADLRYGRLSHLDFYGADLTGADLTGALLLYAKLDAAHLDEATLNWADLHGASIESANFTRADLFKACIVRVAARGATFAHANLSGANFSVSDLRQADFEAADLTKTTMDYADLRGAYLADAILDEVIWYETKYDNTTRWPDGFDPKAIEGLVYQD